MSFVGHDLLFPTIVAKFDRKDLLEDVVELFNSLGENDWSDDIQTLDVQILNRNQKLVDEFTKDVKQYLHEELSFGHDLQMSTSWFTKTLPNVIRYDHLHQHTNAIWSCCYYWQENCEIRFMKAPQSAPTIMCVPDEFNLVSSPSVNYQPEPGEFLLFPAWAMHEVVANNIKTERNSLAFNFMPKGETGVNDSSWVY